MTTIMLALTEDDARLIRHALRCGLEDGSLTEEPALGRMADPLVEQINTALGQRLVGRRSDDRNARFCFMDSI
jgi:hypothetical protein